MREGAMSREGEMGETEAEMSWKKRNVVRSQKRWKLRKKQAISEREEEERWENMEAGRKRQVQEWKWSKKDTIKRNETK